MDASACSDASASPNAAGESRFDRWILPLILLLAISLRLGVVWFRGDQLGIDRDAYLGIAKNLAAGNGFCSPGSKTPTAYRPPLYPLLLAINNPASHADLQYTVGVWNILAGLWTVLFVDQLGAALGLGRWRHLATLLTAVDPLLLYATAQPMTEVVFTGLVTAWLWAVICPVASDRKHLRSLWIGVFFGLAALCRPTIWPLAGLIAMAKLIPAAIRRSFKPDYKSIAAILVGTLLMVSPWVVRNEHVFGQPILMTTHGGYTLLLANNPVYQREVIEQPWGMVWSGESLARWQAEIEQKLHADLGNHPTELERDAWMSSTAKNYIRAEPWTFLRAAVHRVRCLWNITPQGEGMSLPSLVRFGVGAFFTVEYLLAIVGVWVIFRRWEWPVWMPLLLVIVAIQAVHLAYWTDTRMRAPLQPILALLAARALVELARFSRRVSV